MGTETLHNIFFVPGDFDFTLMERVLTEFRVVIVYLKLLLFPHPSQLNIDHDFPLSLSLFDPINTLFALGTIIGIFGLALYISRKERLLSFCVLWFFGNLVIESSVIMLDILFEHRTYLPSMLLSLLVVTLVVRYTKLPWLRVVALCAVALVYAVWTYERNSLWANEIALWSDCVAKSPHKARPHTNLGYALMSQGNIKEAIHHYTEALRIAPSYVIAHNNLGSALARQGKVQEAVRHYTEALRLNPNAVQVYNNLGNLLTRQGKAEEAVRYYTEALRLNPNYALARQNLERVLRQRGASAGPARVDPKP